MSSFGDRGPLPGNLDNSVTSSGRFVPEEDVKAEREKWMQQCMHEVWNLENAAFDRINTQIEEASRRIQEELRAHLTGQLEEFHRRLPLDRLANDVAAVQAAVLDISRAQQQVTELGLERRLSDLRSEVTALQVHLDAHQMSSSRPQDGQVQQLMDEMNRKYAAQEARLNTMFSDLRVELGASQVHTMQEQTMRSVADLGRTLQDVMASSGGDASAVRTELMGEIDNLKAMVLSTTREGKNNDSNLLTLKSEIMSTKERVDGVCALVSDLKKDHLSESAKLQTSIELDQFNQVERMRKLIKEENVQRSTELAAFSGKLQHLESRVAAESAAKLAQPPPPSVSKDEVIALQTRLANAEAQINLFPTTMAGALAGVQARSEAHDRDLAMLKKSIAGPATGEELALMKSQFEAMQVDVSRISKDLDNERRDRCRALADVERITEEVAKATASTIETAEKRIAAATVPHTQMPFKVPSESDRSSSTSANPKDAVTSSQLVKLLSEMDAELRVELNSRIRLLSAELRGELFREVSQRTSDIETKLNRAESTFQLEQKKMSTELTQKLHRLAAVDIQNRLLSSEDSIQYHATILTTLIEALQQTGAATELQVRLTQALGKMSPQANSNPRFSDAESVEASRHKLSQSQPLPRLAEMLPPILDTEDSPTSPHSNSRMLDGQQKAQSSPTSASTAATYGHLTMRREGRGSVALKQCLSSIVGALSVVGRNWQDNLNSNSPGQASAPHLNAGISGTNSTHSGYHHEAKALHPMQNVMPRNSDPLAGQSQAGKARHPQQIYQPASAGSSHTHSNSAGGSALPTGRHQGRGSSADVDLTGASSRNETPSRNQSVDAPRGSWTGDQQQGQQQQQQAQYQQQQVQQVGPHHQQNNQQYQQQQQQQQQSGPQQFSTPGLASSSSHPSQPCITPQVPGTSQQHQQQQQYHHQQQQQQQQQAQQPQQQQQQPRPMLQRPGNPTPATSMRPLHQTAGGPQRQVQQVQGQGQRPPGQLPAYQPQQQQQQHQQLSTSQRFVSRTAPAPAGASNRAPGGQFAAGGCASALGRVSVSPQANPQVLRAPHNNTGGGHHSSSANNSLAGQRL
eukprot:CAMPEP_0206446306 /NCGR_PEP_ID=MMETSP0324_2-20121206/16055_1 /ASSEMBLY_ACC=CAM_ASM_000836 /TAXON_ID=2866 /ORGANISM="Crypthecodinium cohnii, Strain Seligo" /LENGTH=1088 /DNA_ID=CAMNT_0053914747 /DNA_START=191 /DNA_END=3457 /DNA_ORIENTATION=-